MPITNVQVSVKDKNMRRTNSNSFSFSDTIGQSTRQGSGMTMRERDQLIKKQYEDKQKGKRKMMRMQMIKG